MSWQGDSRAEGEAQMLQSGSKPVDRQALLSASMLRGLATFRQATVTKVLFLLLSLLDLTLTLVGQHLGLSEINPFVRGMLPSPTLLLLIKGGIPLFLAWLVPGRLLLPGIAFLLLFAAWNTKELVLFLG